MIGLALLLIAEAGLFGFAQSHDLIWLGLLLPWIFGDSAISSDHHQSAAVVHPSKDQP